MKPDPRNGWRPHELVAFVGHEARSARKGDKLMAELAESKHACSRGRPAVMDPKHENRIGLPTPCGIAPADSDLRFERRLSTGPRPQTIPLYSSVDEKLDPLISLGFRCTWLVPG